MNIQRATPVNEFLAKLIFLLLPTAFVGYYLLENLNVRYAILQNQAVMQSLYLAAGMGASAVLYAFRVRFWPTFAALLLVLFSVYKGIDDNAFGETDVFYLTTNFKIFAFLFSTGWLLGWGYIRLRYFALGISLLVLTGCIALIASQKPGTPEILIATYVPAILYVVYNIFTAEQIYNYKDKTGIFWWFLLGRLGLFGVLAGLLLFGAIQLMYRDIKETVAEYGGSGKAGSKNSMLKKNKDGTFNLEDYSKLGSHLDRDKQLLFCAHINHFFPKSKVPNPLYLTAFYFTKFDTATETFEREKDIPYNDLFLPDPSKIPLFGTQFDTMVIHNSLGNLNRELVDVEIYNCNLSPSTFLAPNVGFFVQPITVEKDFRSVYKSAYRAKSYVSTLNSAYFVYNVDKAPISDFQAMRFEVLRDVKNYQKADSLLMKYYTKMPTSDKFKVISTLAHAIADTAATPVDKVLAIRNYFKSKKADGQPLYKYTDNPGEPDIPNASRLIYFLTENHKGYCAYYAGATLFMLRALGIPSRIVVGFLTEDRSDKNPGWYYYYANQAHAWVQVYFPGFGWLDFDTTVGNTDENRPTPQPDGTPPMQPPKAWLAMDGTVESTDTLRKVLQLRTQHFVFHDVEYTLPAAQVLEVDMKVAQIFKDSLSIPLRSVHKGDAGTIVSYAEALKKMEAAENEPPMHLVARLQVPIPGDEFYVKTKRADSTKQHNTPPAAAPTPDPFAPLKLAAELLIMAVALLFALPGLVFRYYRARYIIAASAKDKAYWGYRAMFYYLHMTGRARGALTPLHYAQKVVDLELGTSLTRYINIYLKQKYAQLQLTAAEEQEVKQFVLPFLRTVWLKTSTGERIGGFLNPVRMAAFFTMPQPEDEE
ncbi:MAG: hypothetical protein EBZ77_00525 [Chitinophagia bacterium]|nr:hypothetical protein [Chitinophagia bacterium]